MLKWKKKIWWKDEEDGKLYINPILAITTLAAVASPTVWMIFTAIK